MNIGIKVLNNESYYKTLMATMQTDITLIEFDEFDKDIVKKHKLNTIVLDNDNDI